MVTGLPVIAAFVVFVLLTVTEVVDPTVVVLPKASIAVTAKEKELFVFLDILTAQVSGVGHDKEVPVPVTVMPVKV